MPNTTGIYGSFMRASMIGAVSLVIFFVLNIIVDRDPMAKALWESLSIAGAIIIGAFTADYMKN